MAEDSHKVDVELSRLLYNLKYEALIRRKAAARKKQEEEEKKGKETKET